MKQTAALIPALILIACADAKHVSSDEFMAQYKWVGQPQSVKAISYLGQKDGKAFLKISSMSAVTQKWSDQVIFTELSELPQAFRNTLPATASATK
ncbi:MAG: hypothetical protein HXX12_16720 [Geothrix sp.]|uniref:hypothetical protein n=1 Tax=Geothrix sp. TaxID=1962974 RepID=UPI001845B224|nr:hypothetical protein [Geothrix sp.]NWJ42607.1 hypothetical protein [Geothrix sp.]WIL19441.1 MAG: hypothetical protein QOZ81_001958 [Geothrix sp.]